MITLNYLDGANNKVKLKIIIRMFMIAWKSELSLSISRLKTIECVTDLVKRNELLLYQNVKMNHVSKNAYQMIWWTSTMKILKVGEKYLRWKPKAQLALIHVNLRELNSSVIYKIMTFFIGNIVKVIPCS